MLDVTDALNFSSSQGDASQALIEEVLNMSLFKRFLVNQEHVALQKHIAHINTEDSIMESDYLRIWQS